MEVKGENMTRPAMAGTWGVAEVCRAARSQATAAPSYNLTTLGTSDWAHWGRGSTYGNFDHKASGGSQISNVTVVGSGANFGGYAINERATSWTDAGRCPSRKFSCWWQARSVMTW